MNFEQPVSSIHIGIITGVTISFFWHVAHGQLPTTDFFGISGIFCDARAPTSGIVAYGIGVWRFLLNPWGVTGSAGSTCKGAIYWMHPGLNDYVLAAFLGQVHTVNGAL